MKIGLIAATALAVLAGAAQADPSGWPARQGRVVRPSETPSSRLIQRLNGGSAFQLICRGGPGLRVGDSSTPLPLAPSPPGFGPQSHGVYGPSGPQTFDWSIAFQHSARPPDHTGRNLQPGQCSPADFPLNDRDPAAIQTELDYGAGLLPGVERYPWETSSSAAFPPPGSSRIHALLDYLANPANYWSFTVQEEAQDTGERFFSSNASRYWRPEFYAGPPLVSAPSEGPDAGAYRSQLPAVAPSKALGRATPPPGATRAGSMPVCDAARLARARNNAAAPGLEAQCRAVGEAPAPPSEQAAPPPEDDPGPAQPDMP